jgi:hypothetical protein
MSVLARVVEKDHNTSDLKVVELPDGEFMARFIASRQGHKREAALVRVYGFGTTAEAAEADALEWFRWHS